ncbi:MAG: cyclic nucleotide-binding domain-containing protein [Magnetococcales bacterium]|nr:cyclic nucleotide-binding domain-containing protein [Magnetococcales bacterium]
MKKVLYILGLLDDRDIDWMISTGDRRVFQPGETLLREKVKNPSIFIIISGKVAVSVGKRFLAEIGLGEVLGEIGLLDSRPPSATITAVDTTVVLAIDFDDIRAKLASDVGFAARIYQALGIFLAQRLRRATLQLIVGESKTVEEDPQDPDEIDPDTLEQISLAGNRFRIIMDKLKDI